MVPAGAKVVFHNGVTDDEYAVLLKRATALGEPLPRRRVRAAAGGGHGAWAPR